MSKKNIRISYDRESKVFSVEVKRAKSVDSDIHGNIVIDYDRNGDVVRVNFYNFNFDAFREGAKELKRFARGEAAALSIR